MLHQLSYIFPSVFREQAIKIQDAVIQTLTTAIGITMHLFYISYLFHFKLYLELYDKLYYFLNCNKKYFIFVYTVLLIILPV